MVSDLIKNIGGSADLAEKRHGTADLHTPIQPPPPFLKYTAIGNFLYVF